MPTIEEVWNTNEGALLFNGFAHGRWVDADTGKRIYFSKRYEIVRHFIGMLLESHIIPEDLADEVDSSGTSH